MEHGFSTPFTPAPCGPKPMSRCILLDAQRMGATHSNAIDGHTVWADFASPTEAEAFGSWAYSLGLNARYSTLHADTNRVLVRDMTAWGK